MLSRSIEMTGQVKTVAKYKLGQGIGGHQRFSERQERPLSARPHNGAAPLAGLRHDAMSHQRRQRSAWASEDFPAPLAPSISKKGRSASAFPISCSTAVVMTSLRPKKIAACSKQ